jgi:hypothetical protein
MVGAGSNLNSPLKFYALRYRMVFHRLVFQRYEIAVADSRICETMASRMKSRHTLDIANLLILLMWLVCYIWHLQYLLSDDAMFVNNRKMCDVTSLRFWDLNLMKIRSVCFLQCTDFCVSVRKSKFPLTVYIFIKFLEAACRRLTNVNCTYEY